MDEDTNMRERPPGAKLYYQLLQNPLHTQPPLGIKALDDQIAELRARNWAGRARQTIGPGKLRQIDCRSPEAG